MRFHLGRPRPGAARRDLGLLLAGQRPPGKLAMVALAGLVALASISLLSITWAESVDNALTGAGRVILYASTFAIFTVAVRGPGSRAWAWQPRPAASSWWPSTSSAR